MKFLTEKGTSKKIIILLIAIILFNVVAPIYRVSADADEKVGGKLFRPVFQMFASVGDLFINAFQYMLSGHANIQEAGRYSIKLGPAAIFSNILPGLDANFINPKYTPEHPYSNGVDDGIVYNKSASLAQSYSTRL